MPASSSSTGRTPDFASARRSRVAAGSLKDGYYIATSDESFASIYKVRKVETCSYSDRGSQESVVVVLGLSVYDDHEKIFVFRAAFEEHSVPPSDKAVMLVWDETPAEPESDATVEVGVDTLRKGDVFNVEYMNPLEYAKWAEVKEVHASDDTVSVTFQDSTRWRSEDTIMIPKWTTVVRKARKRAPTGPHRQPKFNRPGDYATDSFDDRGFRKQGSSSGAHGYTEAKPPPPKPKYTGYYDLLKIAVTATSEEIFKAFKQRAFETHPDRNKSPTAEDEFKQINNAYDVLRDPDKRQRYDKYGPKLAP